jgi:hypothetical protein
MKLNQFSRLAYDEQYPVLWSLGIHVDGRITDDMVINFYVIDDFYCEVYYH